MLTTGIAGIYLVSAAVGFVYLLVGLVMGQLHGHGGNGAAAGHGVDGCASAGHVHDGGASAGPGDGAAHGQAHDHSGMEPHLDIAQTGGLPALAHHGSEAAGPVQIMHRRPFSWRRLVLTLLSPMTIAIFMLTFGAFGMIVTDTLPWLGNASLLPAALAGGLSTAAMLRLMRWMVFKMRVSSHVHVVDLVGMQAEVLTPIAGGKVGEVTYVAGSKRMSAAARSKSSGQEFRRGDRVMIADVLDGVLYVEPWQDIIIGEPSASVFAEGEKHQAD